jgi:hypothetical protein
LLAGLSHVYHFIFLIQASTVMHRTAVVLFELALVITALPLASAHAADLGRALGAGAGIAAGIYTHELGHAAVFAAAGAQDIRVRVPGPECNLFCGRTDATWTSVPSAATMRTVNIAGFVASNAVAEGMLRHQSAARSGFGQGFIATNLYSNAVHVVTYYTKIRGRNGYTGNDIDGYELAGGNPHLLAAALLGYTAYALHRMHKKEIPVLFVSTRF